MFFVIYHALPTLQHLLGQAASAAGEYAAAAGAAAGEYQAVAEKYAGQAVTGKSDTCGDDALSVDVHVHATG